MDDVIGPVLDSVLAIDPGGVIGVYLYGSATTSGLGLESDIDLLVVTRRSMTPDERSSLVSALLKVSGWKGHAETFPEVAHRRPLEVTGLLVEVLNPLGADPWRDFQFGEWLRKEFTQGHVTEPERDPDVVILLATALASHRVLYGPPLGSLIGDVPFELLRDAQLSVLSALVEDLDGDRRNVLLTLSRALITVKTGAIVPKDQAAATVAKHVDAAGAELLLSAAREYRGEEQVDWDSESNEVLQLVQSLAVMIRQASVEPRQCDANVSGRDPAC